MSENHTRAVEAIEESLSRLTQQDCNIRYGESSMAIELSYSLGAISTEEHQYYTARRYKILEREHQQTMGSPQ